jgi:hypothetical protein
MNPRDLENRFLKLLEENNYLAQKALFTLKHLPNGRIMSHRSDFFGVWDLVAMKNNKVYVFQVCSGTKFNAHRRKIEDNFPFTVNPEQYIVYYYKEKGRWTFTLHKRTESAWVITPFDAL